MIAALARPAVAQLARTPRAWVTLAAWTLLGVGFAVGAHVRGSAHGADRVLVGAFGALVVPLFAYALVGSLLGGSLTASVAPLVSFGASPRRAAAVHVALGVAIAAAVCAVLGVAVDAVAHGSADPPLARDALATAYAGALGGAAYAALFAAGASFGKSGAWRAALLVADWLLGAGSGPQALVTPRAHLRNLLGGVPPVDLGERASAVALVLMAIVCVAVAVGRGGRTAPL